MTVRILLGGALVASATCAAADVTPQDVWDNQLAAYDAFGLVSDAAAVPRAEGDALAIDDMRFGATLPFGVGSFELSGMSMRLEPDGTGGVRLVYPDDMTFTLSGTVNAGGETMAGSIDLTLALTGHETLATGTPGDVTYTTTTDQVEMGVGAFDVSANGQRPVEMDDVSLDFFYLATDLASDSRITVTGDDVRMTSAGSADRQIYDFAFGVANEMSQHSVGEILDSSSETTVTLPGGVDIMNLSAALRDGLSLVATMSTASQRTQSVMTAGGMPMSDQGQSIGASTSTLRIDRAGFDASGSGDDVVIEMQPGASIPFPVRAAIADFGIGVAFPLIAEAEPQRAGLTLRLGDLTLNDEVWALFDPGQALPRDPATLVFDGETMLQVMTDLLDVAAVTAAVQAGDAPALPVSASVNEARVEALGASVTGSGAMTFEFAGNSLDVPPVMEGSGEAVMTGVNALVGKLVDAGIIGMQEGLGVRGGLAAYSRPTGPDEQTTSFELRRDGTFLANGLPIQ